MEPTITYILLGGATLLMVSVLASGFANRFGVPSLLLFLALGVLAGSEGLGGIEFSDPRIAVWVGSAALALILFDGGLQTDLSSMTNALIRSGLLLSTAGVLITAGIVGVAAILILNLSVLEGLLLGAVVSSTDAAAVFSVLRSRGIGLSARLRSLIEFESASNDPTAVFLTVTLIEAIQGQMADPGLIPVLFAYRLVGGIAIGYAAGWVLVKLLNRIDLGQDGLYPVLTLAAAGVVFGAGEALGTSGFMAVYVAGLVMSTKVFTHKRSHIRFHDGIAWLMQVSMFLVLGLLVFPSQLAGQVTSAVLVTAVLALLARPLAVFLCLWKSGLGNREKLLISWVGLRGAAPIILATFPMVAGLGASSVIFNTVFVVVIVSVAIQAPTIGTVARVLRLTKEGLSGEARSIEIDIPPGREVSIHRLSLSPGCAADGVKILDIGGPGRPIVLMARREGRLFIPAGNTKIRAGDDLYVVGSSDSVDEFAELFRPSDATCELPSPG